MYTYISWNATWSRWNANTTIYTDIACDINGEEVAWTYGHGGVSGGAGSSIGSGSFTLQRSTATNTATLKVGIYSSGGMYIDHSNDGDEVDFDGDYTSKSWTISTTTTYGAGASITNVTDFDDENGPTITYSYDKGTQVSSASLQAAISFTGAKDDIPYRAVSATGTSYKFNFTQAEKNTLYTLLAAGETASVRFLMKTTETLSSGEILNYTTNYVKTFTFKNYKPLLSPKVWDINPATKEVTHNEDVIVQYMSTVAYDMNVELRKGAKDVIGCYVNNGNKMVEGFTEGTYGPATSNTFYFSATDDRGYTGTANLGLSTFYGEFINYPKLTNNLKCTPIDTQGKFTITVSGNYFNAKFGPDGETNQMTYTYRVYENGEEPGAWSTPTVIAPTMTNNTNYSFTFDHSGLDYIKQYVLEVKVSDLLMEVESSVFVVARPVFYWSNNEFIFNVPVTFNAGFTNNT